jgi:hypothetical protein
MIDFQRILFLKISIEEKIIGTKDNILKHLAKSHPKIFPIAAHLNFSFIMVGKEKIISNPETNLVIKINCFEPQPGYSGHTDPPVDFGLKRYFNDNITVFF